MVERKLVEKLMEFPIRLSKEESEKIARAITTTPYLVIAFRGPPLEVFDWNTARSLDEAKDWRRRMLTRLGVIAADIYEVTIEHVHLIEKSSSPSIAPTTGSVGGVLRCRWCGAPYAYEENLEIHERSCPKRGE